MVIASDNLHNGAVNSESIQVHDKHLLFVFGPIAEDLIFKKIKKEKDRILVKSVIRDTQTKEI